MQEYLYRTRDVDPNSGGDPSPHPEIVASVLNEIKSLGTNFKQAQDNQAKSVSDLRKLMEETDKRVDGVVAERISKHIEAVTKRQEELDKKTTERLDSIEVSLKRLPRTGDGTPDIMKDAALFKTMIYAANGKADQIPATGWTKEQVDLESYKKYNETFVAFLRKYDPRSERLTADQMKALSVGIDPDGGYLVTPAMSARIIKRMFEIDPMRDLCGTETISTDALEMLVDWDEANFGWVGEIEDRSETGTPEWRKKRIVVHEMYAEPRVTQKLIEDAAIDPEAWLANKVSDRFGRAEAASFVNGNGISQPRGFLTYASGTNYGQIEQVALQAAATLTTDGFTYMKYSLIEQFLNRGTWVMNRLGVRDVMLLKDGDGQYIWREGITVGQPSTILGLPLRMATSMPTVAANALAVALADWKEAYLIVDRLGITVLRDPYTAKPYIKLYTRKRVGGDVVNYQAIKLGIVSV